MRCTLVLFFSSYACWDLTDGKMEKPPLEKALFGKERSLEKRAGSLFGKTLETALYAKTLKETALVGQKPYCKPLSFGQKPSWT